MRKAAHGRFLCRAAFLPLTDPFKSPLTARRTTPNERKISSTLPSRSEASLNSAQLKPSSPPPRPSEQNVKFKTPSLPPGPASSGRSASNIISAQAPPSAVVPSAVMPSSPKIAATSSTQTTPIRHHSASTIHKRTPHALPLSQQNSVPPPRSFSQTADMPTSVLPPPQVPEPSISQTHPLPTNNSAPQHSSPSDSTNLLHALNYAFQVQNTASQVQNAANQTLTQLVETVIAVAQGQGLDASVIQNYLAALPISPAPIQQSPSSQIQDPVFHSVNENPASHIPGPSPNDLDESRASTSTPRGPVSSEPSLPPKRKRKSLESPPQVKNVISNTRQNSSGALPGSSQSGRGVFTTKNGRPILVFVQIDTRGRHEIVHQIKVSLWSFMHTTRRKCPTEKRGEDYSRHPQCSLRHPESTFRFLR